MWKRKRKRKRWVERGRADGSIDEEMGAFGCEKGMWVGFVRSGCPEVWLVSSRIEVGQGVKVEVASLRIQIGDRRDREIMHLSRLSIMPLPPSATESWSRRVT